MVSYDLVQVQTTSRCNGYCKFCPYKGSWMDKNNGVMSDKLYLKILHDIDDIDSSFSGKFCPYLMNELFADRDIVKRVEQAYEILHNPTVEISTNASLACLDKVRQLADIMDNKPSKIIISLHGIDKKTHDKLMSTDWNKSISNAIYIMKEFKNTPIVIQSMAMSKDNTYRIMSPRKINIFWKKLIDENDIDDSNVRFSTFMFHSRAGGLDWDWDYKKVHRQIDEKHPFNCPRLHNNLHVLWNGDVVLCCMDYNREVVIGNLKEQSISEVFDSDTWHTIYNKCTGKEPSEDKFICKLCSSPGG